MMRILAGRLKGTQLKSLEGAATRPTRGRVVENLFNILSHNQFTDSVFNFSDHTILDLFAGSGRLGLEALSRGAKSVCFVEKSPQACKIITENIKKCRAQAQTHIFMQDVTTLKNKLAPDFYSLVFCDAPYHQGLGQITLKYLEEHKLLADQAIICMETEKNCDLLESDSILLMAKRHYGASCLYFFKYLKS